MKMKKITALTLTAVLLLCSCDDPMDSPEYTTTTPENSVTGTVTTTSGATEASTEASTSPAEEVIAELPENMMFIETGYFSDFDVFDDYICCVQPKSYTDLTSIIKFYNIDTGKLAGSVTMPEGMQVFGIYEGSGDCLCTLSLYKVVEDKGGTHTENSTAVIFTDFTCDIRNETITELETAVWIGGYAIAKRGINLVEARSDNCVLVEGYEEEGDLYGFKTRVPQYMFAMGENRFVYHIYGYEIVYGFGFFDFGTNTDTFVPDSENLMPIGDINGKIYSYETVWSGRPMGLYATDTETLETVLITEEPFEMGNYDYIDYHIGPDSDFIIVFRRWYTDEEHSDENYALYKMKPETGEIYEEIKLPSSYTHSIGFIGGDKFLLSAKYENGGLLIVDL